MLHSLSMRIYVTHSSGFNYKNELYLPLRNSALNEKHEITLPHEHTETEGDMVRKIADVLENSGIFSRERCEYTIRNKQCRSRSIPLRSGTIARRSPNCSRG